MPIWGMTNAEGDLRVMPVVVGTSNAPVGWKIWANGQEFSLLSNDEVLDLVDMLFHRIPQLAEKALQLWKQDPKVWGQPQ